MDCSGGEELGRRPSCYNVTVVTEGTRRPGGRGCPCPDVNHHFSDIPETVGEYWHGTGQDGW